jgi:lipopolysaccharide cholinephosphotransferase
MAKEIPLRYKDRREDGDTQCRQAQLVALHLLEVFRLICDRHGLRYWLTYGTLIGALRHKGFIPWDDDLDVWMLESDYRKFVSYAKEELPDDVYLELPSDNCRMENGIARLRDNYSCGFVKHSRRMLLNDHHGISIDIFPLYKAGSNNLVSNWILHQYETTYGKWRRAKYGNVTLMALLKKIILFVWTWSMYWIWWLIELLHFKKPYLITRDWYLGYKFWYPKEWICGKDDEDSTMVEFEGQMFPAPAQPELALSKEYENYKELPPLEKRQGYYSIVLSMTPCFHATARQYKESK